MSDQDPKSSPYTYTVVPVKEGDPLANSPIFTQFDLEDYLPSTNPDCPVCRGSGQVIYFIPRPGGPPGNLMIACHTCRKPRLESANAAR